LSEAAPRTLLADHDHEQLDDVPQEEQEGERVGVEGDDPQLGDQHPATMTRAAMWKANMVQTALMMRAPRFASRPARYAVVRALASPARPQR
jgi:hypothetical protein